MLACSTAVVMALMKDRLVLSISLFTVGSPAKHKTGGINTAANCSAIIAC